MVFNKVKLPASLASFNADYPRPIRVVAVGAGLSGIVSAIRFNQRIPNVSIQVYDKNADIGGTWYENRYPGCACDIPSYSYQATFEPSLTWSQFYAPSEEIFRYWKGVVAKYDCERYIKLRHEIVEAKWDEASCKWTLKIRNLTNDTLIEDVCDIVISGTGPLNDFKWPDIPGLHSFKGKLLHSAKWDQDYDWTDKSVAIIGNGSSGIQILPKMLPTVSKMDHYIREPTWVTPALTVEALQNLQLAEGPTLALAPEEITKFTKDPKAYTDFRMALEVSKHKIFKIMFKGSPIQQEATKRFSADMRSRLASKPELAKSLVPSYSLGCRRLTPGPGYLEGLTDPKTTVIRTGIKCVDESGIITNDGVHRPIDALVCATGFNTKFVPRFPVIGIDGVNLQDKWEKVPSTYLAMTVDGFPNYFVSLGPNSANLGGLLLLVEKQVDYFTQMIAKMQRDAIRSFVPKKAVVDGFTAYCDEFLEQTVYTADCRSWFKGGTSDGRVSVAWPGSPMHLLAAIHTPRYEDFEYTYANNSLLSWIGDGMTEMDRTGKYDVFYLNPDNIDYPPCPVAPTEKTNGVVTSMVNGHTKGEIDGVKKGDVMANGHAEGEINGMKNGDVMASVMVNSAL